MPGTGLSTIVQAYADRRDAPQEPLLVPGTTLAEVCRSHVPNGVTVDFLKVDVEGLVGTPKTGPAGPHFRAA
jgi:hypothetical protein